MKKHIQGLYAITDQQLIAPKKFAARVKQVLQGGAQIVQYRDKSQQHQLRFEQASIVVDLCKKFGAISIINDDIELAKIVKADGVHIGTDDDELSYARQELGEQKIIGVSCYADLSLAEQAVADSADYVAFGSIFSSPTKPQAPIAGLDILRQAKQSLRVPIVAIGGITLDNLDDVVSSGADAVAIISGVFANEDISQQALQFSQAFNK